MPTFIVLHLLKGPLPRYRTVFFRPRTLYQTVQLFLRPRVVDRRGAAENTRGFCLVERVAAHLRWVNKTWDLRLSSGSMSSQLNLISVAHVPCRSLLPVPASLSESRLSSCSPILARFLHHGFIAQSGSDAQLEPAVMSSTYSPLVFTEFYECQLRSDRPLDGNNQQCISDWVVAQFPVSRCHVERFSWVPRRPQPSSAVRSFTLGAECGCSAENPVHIHSVFRPFLGCLVSMFLVAHRDADVRLQYASERPTLDSVDFLRQATLCFTLSAARRAHDKVRDKRPQREYQFPMAPNFNKRRFDNGGCLGASLWCPEIGIPLQRLLCFQSSCESVNNSLFIHFCFLLWAGDKLHTARRTLTNTRTHTTRHCTGATTARHHATVHTPSSSLSPSTTHTMHRTHTHTFPHAFLWLCFQTYQFRTFS